MCGRRIKTLKASLFCSSLVKSDPTWLHPEELRFEAENTPIVSMLIEEWNEFSLQMEIVPHFQGNGHLSLEPFKLSEKW